MFHYALKAEFVALASLKVPSGRTLPPPSLEGRLFPPQRVGRPGDLHRVRREDRGGAVEERQEGGRGGEGGGTAARGRRKQVFSGHE